jgi:hypothetical protein
MSGNPIEVESIGSIPKNLRRDKKICPIAKLIYYFLSNAPADAKGWVRTSYKDIAFENGLEDWEIKDPIKELKDLGVLLVKGGRYPKYKIINSIGVNTPLLKLQTDSIGVNTPLLKPPTLLLKVVVVLLEKYGFAFGPKTLAKLAAFAEEDQIDAIESTKLNAKLNPESYINKILDNDCKGIKIKPNEPIEIEINEGMCKSEKKAIFCYNENLKKPIESRCIAWSGKYAAGGACKAFCPIFKNKGVSDAKQQNP